MRTLTADEALANAAHHHCFTRPGSSVEAIAAGLVGLHNTSQVSPYLSLLARLPDFARGDLDALMWDSWQLARFRAMRMTMFVFPMDLLEIAAAATRHLREAWAARWLRDSGFSQREFDQLAAAVEEALAAGPSTVRALRKALAVPQSVDLSGVVSRMCDVGRVAGGRPPRQWRSSIREYHGWGDVLPHANLSRWDEALAVEQLVGRYLRSYGPVTIDDVSWWTGMTKQRCRAALRMLEVEKVAVEGWAGPLFRVAGTEADGDMGAAVHALPLLDPYVQGYRDRTRFLDPARHDHIYDGGGNATATLVHRGRIVGVWQVSEEPTQSVRYHLFDDRPPSVRRNAEPPLAAAGALYFDRPVDVVKVPTMEPLRAGGGRSAAHPLDGRVHRAHPRSTAPRSPAARRQR